MPGGVGTQAQTGELGGTADVVLHRAVTGERRSHPAAGEEGEEVAAATDRPTHPAEGKDISFLYRFALLR